ncbi:MAG: hypothetical protein DVB25_04170 [Verrucomicrobia bacterium]|nr:MAG: hypothetical protein DVB25_04170 [Verrucomicrobiota bacterium]
MKLLPLLSAATALGLVACDTITAPISSGDFNPLSPPGSGVKLADAPAQLKPGDHVRAVVNNTAFYHKLPQGDGDADKTLGRDTPMKVIRIAGTYLQVELDTSGEVGFVPAVMVEDRNARPTTPPNSSAEVQVYPPPGTLPPLPLPAVDPAGLPPEGAIPTVMDPDASKSAGE